MTPRRLTVALFPILLVATMLLLSWPELSLRFAPANHVYGVWRVVDHTNGGTQLPTGAFSIIDFDPRTNSLAFSDGVSIQPGPDFNLSGTRLTLRSHDTPRGTDTLFLIRLTDSSRMTILDSSGAGAVHLEKQVERAHLYPD